MVQAGEVDDELEEETHDECSKYGKLLQCKIVELPTHVRVFLEFESVTSAQRGMSFVTRWLCARRRKRVAKRFGWILARSSASGLARSPLTLSSRHFSAVSCLKRISAFDLNCFVGNSFDLTLLWHSFDLTPL
jgi:hypothetical protein